MLLSTRKKVFVLNPRAKARPSQTLLACASWPLHSVFGLGASAQGPTKDIADAPTNIRTLSKTLIKWQYWQTSSRQESVVEK